MATIVQLAGLLPKDPQFRAWLSSASEVEHLTPEEAAEVIRVACGVDSRRQLALDAGAADRFHNLIRKPFLAFKETQQ